MTRTSLRKYAPKRGKALREAPQILRLAHTTPSNTGESPLRGLRKSRNLTLDALSDLTGISPSHLSRLEAGGRRLNEDLIASLSQALACPPTALLGSRSPKNSSPYAFSTFQLPTPDTPQGMPVYGLLTAFDGSHVINRTDPLRHFGRPPSLEGQADAYMVLIDSKAYMPKYGPGDGIFVTPSSPLTPGCIALFLGAHNAFQLGYYLSEIKGLIHMRGLVDGQDHFLMRDALQGTHRIIGSMELSL